MGEELSYDFTVVIPLIASPGSNHTFNVPGDWNNSNNNVQTIGGGGGGASPNLIVTNVVAAAGPPILCRQTSP